MAHTESNYVNLSVDLIRRLHSRPKVMSEMAMLRQVTPRLSDKVLENGFDPVAIFLVRTTHRLRDIKVVVQGS
jgi:hypothetical protein